MGGTLRKAIDGGLFLAPLNNTSADTSSNGSATPAMLWLDRVTTAAIHIARGMVHVHGKDIIHGDLTPSNVLLQSCSMSSYGFTAKLADFGLSVTLATCQTHVSGIFRGTLFYAPPEVYLDGCLMKAGDVYSFGILLWELIHGTPPWRQRGGHALRPVQDPATLLVFNDRCSPPLAALVRHCTATSPTDRPNFERIMTDLSKVRLSAGLPPIPDAVLRSRSTLTASEQALSGSRLAVAQDAGLIQLAATLDGGLEPMSDLDLILPRARDTTPPPQ